MSKQVNNFDKLLQSSEYNEAITTAKSIIEPFLSLDPSKYTESDIVFIDDSLPTIFKKLFQIEKPPRKIAQSIVSFVENYLELIVKLNFNEKLLRALCDCLQHYQNRTTELSPIQLSESEKESIIDDLKNADRCIRESKDVLPPPLLVNSTMKLCFSRGFFKTAINIIRSENEDKENIITNIKLSLIFRLFYIIEGYLNEDIVLTILPIFADAIIYALTKAGEDIGDMAQMLTCFIDIIPKKSDQILKLLCKLVSSGPVNKRLITVRGIRSIVERGFVSKKILEEVKNTLLNDQFNYSNSQIFEQVLTFLPILSKDVSFTDTDLIFILDKVHSPANHICKCIAEVIPNVKTNLKEFTQSYLESGIYSPAIICAIISRINDKKKSQSLFSLLLRPPESYENDQFSQDNRELLISTIKSSFEHSQVMKNLIESKMEETEDPEDICSLSQIILNAPNLNHIDMFIEKVINLSEEYESLIPILKSFSSLLGTFDSKSTITFLFNKAYHHFINSKNSKYLNQILPVLTEWFEEREDAPYIDVDHIIAKLMKISFMYITTKFEPFVSNVIKRSSKISDSRLKEFLLKIIYDTVPQKFASWAINNVFEYFHDDKDTITCIVKILTYHLKGQTITVDLFNNVVPNRPKNTSTSNKKIRFTTRSRSSGSRNQRKKKRYSEYSDNSDDDDDSDKNSSKSGSDEDENDRNINNNDNVNDEYDEEDSMTLKEIIMMQSATISETNREKKRNNAIHLIKRAAQYEADYFKIGDLYGTNFNISVINLKDNSEFEFEIGLHPFHTCRRLYLEVANMAIDKNLSKEFNLYIPKKLPKEHALLKSSTPISEIVEININKIKLLFEENSLNESISDSRIDTNFLNCFDDPESTRALYDLLSTENNQSRNVDTNNQYLFQIILETLQLFEQTVDYEAVSPLQKVLHKNYDHPLDFENCLHLFPLALSAYSQTSMSSTDFSKVIDLAINRSFDNFSAVIIMKAITRIECNGFIFTPELIEKGLIQNKHKSLRHALLCHFNISPSHASSPISPSMINSYDEIVSLIPLVLEPSYRENSKEFLACFKKCNLSKDVFIPYYKKLNQYETVNNVDQTFISLLKLIPKNEETIKLTYERISVAPTVRNPQNPFVHCEKSRKAAFDFLTTDQVYPILINHLSLLPEVPSSSQKLLDDFTFKGRNGITNLGSTCYLNTLMQSLNTASNVTNRILSLPTEGLTPYLLQLRDFMGQLRYSRNPSISIKSLIDTIPNFDPYKQEDTYEFLLMIINRVFDELKEESKPLKEELELILETKYYQIGSDESEGDSNIDNNIVLSLQAQYSTNLLDSIHQCFKDDIVDDVTLESSNKKVTAIRKQRVLKWPNYLIIHLERYDFNAENIMGKKLVNEFGFPMTFNTGELQSISSDKIKDECIDYELSAILIHGGDIESGHYFAIVKGENEDWYLCDDNDIKKFDIAQIPNLSFGIKTDDRTKDNKILTAYLLFYRRVGLEIFEPHLTPDFEERINRFNETTWPSFFFFSRQFLNFTENLTALYPNNDATTEVALTCLFKIAVVNDSTARKWQLHIQQNFITNQNQCVMFFTFIKEKIDKTLGQIVNLSDCSCDCLKSVIFSAFKQLQNTTDPLITVLNCLDFAIHKRSITLACELITLACQDLHVSWKNEEEALLMMVKYVTMEMGRDNSLFSKIRNSLAESTENLIKILSNVVLQKGVIEPIRIIYQNDVLYRLLNILEQSESFKTLTTFALSLQPSLISSIDNTKTEVTELLMNASHKIFADSLVSNATNGSQNNANNSSSGNNSHSGSNSSSSSQISNDKNGFPLFINSASIGKILEKLCFCNKKAVRRRICKTLCQVMDDPDPVVANYINNRVFEPDLICPSVVDESTFLDMLVSLLPIGLKKWTCFNEFSKVLTKLCIAAPFATSLSFAALIEAIPRIANSVSKNVSQVNHFGFSDDENEVDFGGFNFQYNNDEIGSENDEDDGDESDDDENDNSIGVDLLIRLMIVVKHLVAFNDELRDQVTPQIIEIFLNLESGREEALQFVALFQKEASGSQLFAACVSEALRSPFSDISNKIIEMVSNGMSPGNFAVPDTTKYPDNIKIATALFRSCEKQRDKLKNYILYILQHLKPIEALSLQPFAEAVQMIENHYQAKLEELMQYECF